MISTLILMAGPFLMGYLMGSIPFGLLLTRAAGLGDIRNVGSGNIGATNVLRTGRKGLAAATLLFDALKGVVAVLIADQVGQLPAVAAAAGAVLGHMFPVWLGFKGGKGVATTLGVMWGLSWPVGAIACAAWLLLAAAFRYSSLAALLSVVVAAIAAWFLTDPRAAMLLTLLVPLVWVRHHENIARLLNGTESKIGQGKKQAA
ncbi:glycerol-3-phosphate 1-O-acyltransferase PlsY [Reyranella sp.]|jgi:glycerol-3-phosphate acyltransferase PlsY|uniref:glycerol-3-phosphate 1-O-acyltransferase PlsY n=1 Tax=Reyranella sp. TaxID=1929291 RepID=UPI000BDA63F9|nr:glycerol-3-phosphate 1-O-acyltransferase PlsY [Reyranella sp.]OYY46107.1 MAG: acyl-phosphate glycerol 3-phosphate acyltransferase [Rhodospirillales bacterium 35-66-84]OYZ96487.1 MAG: acyl-phosphate glycerol 3-phosphate acyltransferase [Rhodospirillales bacterium 24-66-33]OZB28349.1 MAG: acyl-phosphate glycerol 3-phosphate acyltransferase [Rhodospirillales bacterium 39-66-50]HQS14446.1 glycerol-3-phosphate 1-O-acyltransferase PlsY [Reyranella sp.]HQT11443.1 glycerol-3-phosphate 1-O-acyltrans